jgi:L-lactate dehydrogenase complex protein LldF
MSSKNDHAVLATDFLNNGARAKWHDESLWFVRSKRDRAAAAVPEWELLRKTAEEIKAHVVANLPDLLEQFERNALARGIQVHWAKDGEEHNQIVLEILQRHEVKRLVKSKSMLTEECHLNPFLERHGISVVDTDLGERIVQLRDEPPSHIVLPAIHIKKEEVGEVFHEHLGTEKGASDPQYLTEAARQHLREQFMNADAGLTGVNFAIADTGGFVVCTNEGNADLGVSLPKVHIACMGLEKIIPRFEDLGVFTRLLARSATGQPITTYTSHFHGPREGAELHVVIVDNGRSSLRDDETFRRSLSCIRCGACMNTCPVYRRSGGHSYQSTVPGPIGSILAPARDAHKHHSLPFACSLCGSCTDVCPVKIDLHHELLEWRREIAARNVLPKTKKWSMKFVGFVLRRPWLYRMAGALARFGLRWTPRWLLYSRLNAWGRQRELPEPPERSFRSMYRKRGKRS